MDKKQLRKVCIDRRDALCEAEREAAQSKMVPLFLKQQEYQSCKILLGFVPFRTEIDVTGILQDALDSGRRLFLPKVEGKQMQFYEVSSLAELTVGYQGILEPTGDTIAYSELLLGESTCLLMPGIGFDHEGNRLGYGGGFYDRFLEQYPVLNKVAIAVGYECQLVQQIQTDEYDIRPAKILLV